MSPPMGRVASLALSRYAVGREWCPPVASRTPAGAVTDRGMVPTAPTAPLAVLCPAKIPLVLT